MIITSQGITQSGSTSKVLSRQTSAITMLLGSLSAALLLTTATLGWSTYSSDRQLQGRVQRLEALGRDAIAIRQLRNEPHHAADRELPTQDLVAQVEAAMKSAGLPERALVSVIPQPPRKNRAGGVMEIAHRLTFDNVSTEGLVRFAVQMARSNPSLRNSAVDLRAVGEASWGAELQLEYAIYEANVVVNPAAVSAP